MAFILQEVSYGLAYEPMASTGKLPGVSSASHEKDLLLSDPSLFKAPLDNVTLKEVHKGSKDVFIIHIQDPHTNLSGQENLSKALESILSSYGDGLVLSEGGEGNCSLSSLKKIAPLNIWQRVAKNYLIQGKLQGEEYLGLTSDLSFKLYGIEDMKLYFESVKRYGSLAKKRQEILQYLSRSKEALSKLKKRFYPKELLDYEKLKDKNDKQNFEGSFKELLKLSSQRKMDLKDLPNVERLKALFAKEENIDFNLANLEQASLIQDIQNKAGPDKLKDIFQKMSLMKDKKVALYGLFQNTLRIAQENKIRTDKYPNLLAYLDYLKSFCDIDLDSLLDEIQKLEDRVYAGVLKENYQLAASSLQLAAENEERGKRQEERGMSMMNETRMRLSPFNSRLTGKEVCLE